MPKWEDHNKQEHYSLQLHTWAFGSEGVSSYYSCGTIHCCILTYAAPPLGEARGESGGSKSSRCIRRKEDACYEETGVKVQEG